MYTVYQPLCKMDEYAVMLLNFAVLRIRSMGSQSRFVTLALPCAPGADEEISPMQSRHIGSILISFYLAKWKAFTVALIK